MQQLSFVFPARSYRTNVATTSSAAPVVLIVGGDAERGHRVRYLGAEREPGATLWPFAVVRGRARRFGLAAGREPSADRLAGGEPAGQVEVGGR